MERNLVARQKNFPFAQWLHFLPLVLLFLPWATQAAAVLDVVTFVLVYGLLAMSLNLLVGYTGMVSFGHATFLGVGGYAVALATQKYGLPFSAGVGLAIIVRVLGLILCALAIQFIIMGLGEALPGMFATGVTTPYPAGGH